MEAGCNRDMVETTVGREVVQIVELVQPFCTRTFGVAPCTATGEKCFNTRSTCKDAPNFDLGSKSLFFSRESVAARGVVGAPYIIPSLVSVKTAPTRINLTGANPNAVGLGNRALASVTFKDHPHTDRVVDPYVDGRSYSPLERGSFWTKWIARNKYWQKTQINIYEGYAGQTLAQMVKRTYFMEGLSAQNDAGQVTIQARDILARLEARKAQAPIASPGVLYAGIDATQTSIEVANALEADYAAAGVIRISDEIITYTARAASTNGVTFTGCTRGEFNTVADAHDVDENAQQCLYFEDERADDVLSHLLTTYGGIEASWLDTVNWASEFDNYLPFYLLTALITDPEAVVDLVSQIIVQVGLYLWWDERDRLVKMKAIRGVDAQPDTISAAKNILKGTFAISKKPKERASQVWVYYDQTDYIGSRTDPTSYGSSFILANLESEGENLYGEASIRKIFARWLTSGALAENTASKIITRFVDTPSECTFEMDAKDRSYWVGDTIAINHHLDVDEFGAKQTRFWTIVSAEEVMPGERVKYTAEDTTLYGKIFRILAGGAADYNPAGGNPFDGCFIGDADGLLSDGTTCGRIA